MDTCTGPARRLGFWWVLRRELEIQARPSERNGYSYRGLWRPLVCGALFMLLLFVDAWSDSIQYSCLTLPPYREPLPHSRWHFSYLYLLGLYALYRAHAAACLGAGSLRDLVVLRHAGVSPGGVIAGKLVASLLPLGVELALMTPLLLLVMVRLGVSLLAMGVVGALLVLQTFGFGLVGMALAMGLPGFCSAVGGVRGFMFLLFYAPGLVVATLALGLGPDAAPWEQLLVLVAIPNPVLQVLGTVHLVAPIGVRGGLAQGPIGPFCVGTGLCVAVLLLVGLFVTRAISTRLK